MTRRIAGAADLDAYLRPLDLGPVERLDFDLSGFRSTATRELLQIRMRKQAQAFGVGDHLVAANVTPDGLRLEVDLAALLAANDIVRTRLAAGLDAAIGYLGLLAAAGDAVDAAARDFAASLEAGMAEPAIFHAYLDAATTDQELGALKFCMPGIVAERIAALMPASRALRDALMRSETASLWSSLQAREVALARVRLRAPAEVYRRLLGSHQRNRGYLGAEDVDFEAAETLAAIDARIARLAAEGLPGLMAQVARLVSARNSDRTERAEAARIFADAVAGGGEDMAWLSALILLSRRLAAHEDRNRRRKMRLLRDLRDLAVARGRDIAVVGLRDLAAACDG